VAPRRDGIGDHTEYLEHHGRTGQCGGSTGIKRWSNLDHITADQIETSCTANHQLCLDRREATDFRCSGSRRVHWIQTIDIEGQIAGTFTDNTMDLADDRLDAHLVELFHVNHTHTRVVAELPDIKIIEGTPDTDLDGALRIDQLFFNSAPERCTVVKL
ncbi:uncharacterized protein METZ01_LOCUS240665, partial [marine metagenome]